jgi:DNA-binding transcriptional regulator YhcF (GntR family)
VAELGDWVQIDARETRPLFDQLRSQIIEAIRDGRLPPGTRLPTVRELAGQLNLAVNTVARAYRELEAMASSAAHTYVTAARALGLSRDEALRYVHSAFG